MSAFKNLACAQLPITVSFTPLMCLFLVKTEFRSPKESRGDILRYPTALVGRCLDRCQLLTNDAQRKHSMMGHKSYETVNYYKLLINRNE